MGLREKVDEPEASSKFFHSRGWEMVHFGPLDISLSLLENLIILLRGVLWKESQKVVWDHPMTCVNNKISNYRTDFVSHN